MTTSVERRIRRLEVATGGNRCPECGFDGDWHKVRFHVEPTSSKGEPEHCGTCGRPTRIVLTWGDRV